jgi:hypothetical protein
MISCQKDSNHPDGQVTGYAIKGKLKQYRFYYPPGFDPDSMRVTITYDTISRFILLSYYYSDMTGGPTWKYQYDDMGYLTSVHDVTPGDSSGQLIDSFIYDGNKDLLGCLTYENKMIPYVTNYSSAGKTVLMYDTSYSGYLGGNVFGTGTIMYNTKNQMTDRYLTKGDYAKTGFYENEHEVFSYDGSDNISQYSIADTDWVTNPDGTPGYGDWSYGETYGQRDGRPNELYQFDSLLLKGVTHLLGGNALMDPLENYIGVGEAFYFQTRQSPLTQANINGAYNFLDQPLYDNMGRLTKTSLYGGRGTGGLIQVYLSYY